MSKYTRRRNHPHHPAKRNLGMFNQGWPSLASETNIDPAEETFEQSEQRINAIIMNVQTTREDLQKELVVYEEKMTILEEEFTQYQKLATKVMAALEVIDSMTAKLTGKPESPENAENAEKSEKSENAEKKPEEVAAVTSTEPQKQEPK